MNVSPAISFQGTTHRQVVSINEKPKGEITALYADGTNRIVGYTVKDYSKDQTVNSSCQTMNQAKAFSEYYFGKEA
ncbi:hypothetical protein [Pontibacter kalidii]|uniref:hypothetical protein n=1 Tax=Pontibacter kalidii TaxID=2592049 RepID=UPI002255D20A|nr:hypothetical protein [Pontibacter kalidii]